MHPPRVVQRWLRQSRTMLSLPVPILRRPWWHVVLQCSARQSQRVDCLCTDCNVGEIEPKKESGMGVTLDSAMTGLHAGSSKEHGAASQGDAEWLAWFWLMDCACGLEVCAASVVTVWTQHSDPIEVRAWRALRKPMLPRFVGSTSSVALTCPKRARAYVQASIDSYRGPVSSEVWTRHFHYLFFLPVSKQIGTVPDAPEIST